MSSPSAARYHITSEAELQRRRLAAARARFARLQEIAQTLNIHIAATNSSFEVNARPVSEVDRPSSSEVHDWESACARLDSEVARARDAADAAIMGARLERLDHVLTGLPAVAFKDVETDTQGQTGADSTIAARLQAALHAIPPSASNDEVAAIEELTRRARVPRQLLARVRFEVQRLQDRHRRAAANRELFGELIASLDGLGGQEVEEMRGFIRGLDLSEPPPGDIRARVDIIRVRAEAERDATFVTATAGEVLKNLGLAVHTGFATAVPGKGALVDLPSHPRHAVRVRTRDGQLLLNVVRFDADRCRDPEDDASAEAAMCSRFAAFTAAMFEHGVELEITRFDAPGTVPVELGGLADRDAVSSSSEGKRPRERERGAKR